MNDPECVKLLQGVGENLNLQQDVKSEIRQFVLRKIYDEGCCETYGEVRASKWCKMKKKKKNIKTTTR